MENGFAIGNIIIFEESIVSICQIRGSCPLCLLIHQELDFLLGVCFFSNED